MNSHFYQNTRFNYILCLIVWKNNLLLLLDCDNKIIFSSYISLY